MTGIISVVAGLRKHNSLSRVQPNQRQRNSTSAPSSIVLDTDTQHCQVSTWAHVERVHSAVLRDKQWLSAAAVGGE